MLFSTVYVSLPFVVAHNFFFFNFFASASFVVFVLMYICCFLFSAFFFVSRKAAASAAVVHRIGVSKSFCFMTKCSCSFSLPGSHHCFVLMHMLYALGWFLCERARVCVCGPVHFTHFYFFKLPYCVFLCSPYLPHMHEYSGCFPLHVKDKGRHKQQHSEYWLKVREKNDDAKDREGKSTAP